MRIHDNSFTILNSQEEAGKLHADIWHPPKLTHALQDLYPTAPSGGPREDIAHRRPAMGRVPTTLVHPSQLGCVMSPSSSPLTPPTPHQFRSTSCTCNKNIPVHDYSATDTCPANMCPTPGSIWETLPLCSPACGIFFFHSLVPIIVFPTLTHTVSTPTKFTFLSRNASTPTSHNIKFGFWIFLKWIQFKFWKEQICVFWEKKYK